ncbi:Na(+)/H(+) exchange regulatory cofactor NHE-RF2 isoform X2 [Periophthalmus magnuspinnatus]|uniref:Na(+)/H(+) exchange regulatory cofactor NHE-RF2 isoform X2 n=1 Tax=Periophthalmus magnuspinnatus TaxID=409849 RepID=UPI00145A2895|nr:Na(+)/H(+) exchange regulatory cofactor NHE-RF2 isoform X2 [Periophthalmus magnuspinnatus]
MDGELRPRLCFLTKGERGYGFHLHGERNKGGQFIRKVEPGSCADLAGLRAGDRVVEVNGENVENATHHEVVSRIREVDFRTRLLVVDRETEEYLHSRGLTCTEALAIEMGTLSPRPSPAPTPSTSPIPPFLLRELEALSPKTNRTYALSAVHPLTISHSPTPTITDGKSSRNSIASSITADTELQGEPSPEPTPDLLPRLCHLLKSDSGYGFNLHSKKKKAGQFVRSVDPGSPAEQADIRPGDRIVEVNGLNVDGLKHSEVVTFIRAGGDEVQLLVVDQETDELFKRLGITPTTSHVKEVYVDEVSTESIPPTPSPTIDLSSSHPPIINVTLTDGSISPKSSPKSRTNGSTASQSSRSSTTQSEISSSDMSIQVPDEDDRCVSDPFAEGGLRLSPTAAEARKKAVASRNKKRAPPMDWSKKKEIFSNY